VTVTVVPAEEGPSPAVYTKDLGVVLEKVSEVGEAVPPAVAPAGDIVQLSDGDCRMPMEDGVMLTVTLCPVYRRRELKSGLALKEP
jgi:hypothetical protein